MVGCLKKGRLDIINSVKNITIIVVCFPVIPQLIFIIVHYSAY